MCHWLYLESPEETGEIFLLQYFLHIIYLKSDSFNSKDLTCFVLFVCLFLDDHSRLQYLWLSSKHENPEALAGSNQGSYCLFFKASHVTNLPTSRTTFQAILHVSCFPLSKIFGWFVFHVSHPGAMSPHRAGFCCLTAGTIWAGLQNHQVTVWEISAIHGSTDLQKWGERPGTHPSEWARVHSNSGNVQHVLHQHHLTSATITISKAEKPLWQAFSYTDIESNHVIWVENNQSED